VVEVFETAEELREGKRRRAYPELDVLYYFQEDKHAIDCVCLDFREDGPPEKPSCFDIISKCMDRMCPCIFVGIDKEVGAGAARVQMSHT
jgi:hypothetical protein